MSDYYALVTTTGLAKLAELLDTDTYGIREQHD